MNWWLYLLLGFLLGRLLSRPRIVVHTDDLILEEIRGALEEIKGAVVEVDLPVP